MDYWNQYGRMDWASELADLVEATQAPRAVPTRETLSAEEEIRCQINGGALLQWLNNHGPAFMADRSFCKAAGAEDDPFIVFTSDPTGLVAYNEIVGQTEGLLLGLPHDAFMTAHTEYPDPDNIWHVHFWVRFKPELSEDVLELANERYPLQPGEVYWQHSEGTWYGPKGGRGVEHLWKWDGAKPTLLEEAITHWVG